MQFSRYHLLCSPTFESQWSVSKILLFVNHFFDWLLTEYSVKWRRRDSNSWPPACKAGALPTELRPPYLIGGHLLSHTVSSIVPSAVWVLTIVFGMGTGVTPRRIATKNFCYLPSCNMMLCYNYSESASLLPHRANPHITIFLSQHPCKHACSLLIQKPLLHSVFDN